MFRFLVHVHFLCGTCAEFILPNCIDAAHAASMGAARYTDADIAGVTVGAA